MGGRLSCPFYVTGADPPYRPEMMLWVELPGELILAGKILDPNPPAQPLVEALRDAFRRPLAGPPRRPARIRVATEAEAAEVRAFVGPSIPVLVAPAPELPAVMDEMLEMMPEGAEGAVEPSYFEEGRISPDLVARLFAAGRVLHAAAPWKQAHDQQTLRMDIPALGVEGACVSIIGALGQTLGVLVFPSQTALDAYLEAAGLEWDGEGPVDLGTTVLSLTFEKADELPDGMRREALRHGWPVAGPDAYPVVEHRDRDGVPRPLTERDMRIATACASAVAAFTATQGHGFSAEPFEPVSVTFTGDDEVGVRLTAPYDAAGLFEPDPQLALSREGTAEPTGAAARPEGTFTGPLAGAPPPGPSRPSRNAPCWCGSGKKYKRCHLDADLAADRARVAEPAPIHTADERLVRRMARFAIARFGERWLEEAARPFADPEAATQLFQPWSVYHQPADGRPVVDWFLAEEGRRLSLEERSWLEAQRVSWLGVWEVLAVTPGRGMAVRELLTGIERDVVEVSGSRTLVARDTVLGRVVDHGGLSVFAGVHPRPLPPLDAAEVVGAVRERLRRRREIPVERLREPALERYLISRWEEVVAAMDARHRAPPALRNTDGDELLFTTDHFAFDPAQRDQVEAALASVEQLESTERGQGERRYTFTRPESATPRAAAAVLPGGTILGHVRLGASGLTLETNSLARADRLRRRLESACGALLAHRAREHTSPGALMKSAPEVGDRRKEPEEPPPEIQQALADWTERYYDAWLERPVPALGGMTPRQASRTRAGREALDLLLKDMENRAARGPGSGQPDVAGLRAKLGMEE